MSWWQWFALPRHGWSLVAFLAGAAIAGAFALALLCAVPPRYRKGVVAAVTFIAGLYYAIEFLVPPTAWWFTSATPADRVNLFSEWLPLMGILTQIIGSFALLLGISNLFQIHGHAVARRSRDWYNSAAFFIAFFSIVIIGFVLYTSQQHAAALKPGSAGFNAAKAAVDVNSNIFKVLFRGFLTSLDATMFSLIAFYIVSAAYRAFRVRSAEAAFMMITAAIIMLGIVPIGALATNWLPEAGFWSAFRLNSIALWLLVSPNMAAQRAIAFGIAVGSLAMGLRIWLSLERGSFFDRQL